MLKQIIQRSRLELNYWVIVLSTTARRCCGYGSRFGGLLGTLFFTPRTCKKKHNASLTIIFRLIVFLIVFFSFCLDVNSLLFPFVLLDYMRIAVVTGHDVDGVLELCLHRLGINRIVRRRVNTWRVGLRLLPRILVHGSRRSTQVLSKILNVLEHDVAHVLFGHLARIKMLIVYNNN